MVTWVSPTGYGDPDNVWSLETNAYDEDTSPPPAYTTVAGSYLVLTHSDVSCDRVRIYAGDSAGSVETAVDPNVTVDVYYGGAWHNIHSGTITKLTWVELSIGSTQDVGAMQIAANTISVDELDIYEADFGQVPPPGPGQMLDPTSKTW